MQSNEQNAQGEQSQEKEIQPIVEAPAQEIVTDKKKPKTSGMPSVFLIALGLMVVYGLVYAYAYTMGVVGVVNDITNSSILEIFKKYSAWFGFIFGFLSAIIFLILTLILRFARKFFPRIMCLLLALSLLPWYLLGRQLVYFEARYTDIGRAIISYVGHTLLGVSKFLIILLIIIFIIKLIIKNFRAKKEMKTVLVLVALPFFLSGCLGELLYVLCGTVVDADHCYQSSAVQEGQDDSCEKIKGTKFGGGSNPPRDKCYLMIAENTGDLSACDQIRGGAMSYTKEECILGSSIKNENPSGCKMLTGSAYEQCKSSVGSKISASEIIDIDNQIAVLKKELENADDPGLLKQLEGLEKRKSDSLDLISKDTKDYYTKLSDPIYQEIMGDYAVGDMGKETRDKMVALTDALRIKGDQMSKEEYTKMRDYMKMLHDPENDIEQMDDSKIVQKRWNEKLGSAVDYLKFWKGKDSAKEMQMDEQLQFYTRMLERQDAIAKQQSEMAQDLERNGGIFDDYVKGKITDKIQEEALKVVFGSVTESTVGLTTKVLGEALDTVKAEAKSKEFRGLVGAYNKGMADELAGTGGDIEKAHARVMENIMNDPYIYEDQNTFAKYGNLIEQKDCDGSNPHCINKDVFFKAMKKSYKYQHTNK